MAATGEPPTVDQFEGRHEAPAADFDFETESAGRSCDADDEGEVVGPLKLQWSDGPGGKRRRLSDMLNEFMQNDYQGYDTAGENEDDVRLNMDGEDESEYVNATSHAQTNGIIHASTSSSSSWNYSEALTR